MANSKRKCTNCKDYEGASVGIATAAGFFCNIECIAAYSVKRRDRLRAKEKRKADAVTKEERRQLREANRRKLSWQHKVTQPRFNRMRVLEELLWFKEQGLDPT